MEGWIKINTLKFIDEIVEIIPDEKYNIKRQLYQIRKEQKYVNSEYSYLDAIFYIIERELNYPPEEEWEYKLLSKFNGIPIEQLKEIYRLN